GTNLPRSNYFLIKNAVPQPLLRADGHVMEIDLDKDGAEEVIAWEGTYAITRIFKLDKDVIKSTNINEQLEATAVIPKKVGQEIIFIAYYKATDNIETFRLCSQNWQLIPLEIEGR
ncbi:MAG: hypothetical protein ACPLRH_05425, partial [Desulfotomaculales bacterium]